jgi:hypothetical protein
MNVANVDEKSMGPMTMAMPRTEPMAPWSSPCSEGETCWVIIDWDAGPASPHRQLIGTAAKKTMLVCAHPKSAKPRAPRRRPAKRVRRSPRRLTVGPTMAADTIIEQMPTRARELPTVRWLQP